MMNGCIPSLAEVHASEAQWTDPHCCTWCEQSVDSQRALQFWGGDIRHYEGMSWSTVCVDWKIRNVKVCVVDIQVRCDSAKRKMHII